MLYGFSQVILQGALVTLELALSSVVLLIHQTFKIAIGKDIYVVEQVAFFPHNS